MAKKAIGILGGTFNPIHNGHIAMADSAWKQAKLDEIWFMPSKNPPHKSNREIVGEEHRSRMIQAAIGDKQHFRFSDYELKREGITYSADTLVHLNQDYPEYDFYFIMGGDSFFGLEHWYHPEIIMKYCTILAISRDGVSQEQMQYRAKELERKYQASVRIIRMERNPVSSSQIRDRIHQKQDIRKYVPEQVANYIEKYRIYGTDCGQDLGNCISLK